MSLISPSTATRLLALTLFAGSCGMLSVQGAETVKPADAKAAASAAALAAAKERAKKGTVTAADVRKLFDELSKQRDVMISDFEALAKQMKDATEDQKKQIKEKMEEQKRTFDEVTTALHKQIREEQRKQRQNAATTKR